MLDSRTRWLLPCLVAVASNMMFSSRLWHLPASKSNKVEPENKLQVLITKWPSKDRHFLGLENAREVRAPTNLLESFHQVSPEI